MLIIYNKDNLNLLGAFYVLSNIHYHAVEHGRWSLQNRIDGYILVKTTNIVKYKRSLQWSIIL